MTTARTMPNAARLAAVLLLCGSATLLQGCSQEFASADDVYVPVASAERYPIDVVDKPFKLNVSASSGRIAQDDMNRLVAFARAAQSKGATPVIVSYPSGSRKAAGVSQQAMTVLKAEGLDPTMIRRASYNGKSDVVALSFTRRVAESKPCGNWPDLSANSKNEPIANSGCAVQQNFAAMVVNPDDFVGQRRRDPVAATSRAPAIQAYQSGAWTNPANSSGATLGSAGP